MTLVPLGEIWCGNWFSVTCQFPLVTEGVWGPQNVPGLVIFAVSNHAGATQCLDQDKIWYREHTIGSVSHHVIFPSDQLRGVGLGMGAHIFQNSQICGFWPWSGDTVQQSGWNLVGKSTTQLRCSLWSVKGFVYPTSFAMTSLVVVVAISCYRQHCAQRKAPVYQLLRGRFWGFSSCRGDTLHWWGWNLAGRRSTPPCQISPPLVQR